MYGDGGDQPVLGERRRCGVLEDDGDLDRQPGTEGQPPVQFDGTEGIEAQLAERPLRVREVWLRTGARTDDIGDLRLDFAGEQ